MRTTYAYDALVLDAAYKQSLATARSLGRAGLRVAMGESLAQCDPTGVLAAFRTRYTHRNVVLPNYGGDGSAFGAAVAGFVREFPTRVVIPAGDASIAALAGWRQQLASLGSVLAVSGDTGLAIANDKARTLALAEDLGIACPRTIPITDLGDLEGAASALGYPFVLKPTVSWTGYSTDRVVPVEVVDETEARTETARLRAAGAEVLAQELATGRREGVTLFMIGGRVVARCGHFAHRTTPPLGGASVMRESIEVPWDIGDCAVRLVNAIGLDGVCEVEFRRDDLGRPLLMEVNARLAGTIENSVRSGVNFPLMLWTWAAGRQLPPMGDYRVGVRTRWLHGDLRWLRENMSRGGRPDSVPRARCLWIFASEFARTRHYDFFDSRDMKPGLSELRGALGSARRLFGTLPQLEGNKTC